MDSTKTANSGLKFSPPSGKGSYNNLNGTVMGLGASGLQGVEKAEDELEMASSGTGVLGSLTSLWSTSSEKDDTCVQWGLVSDKSTYYLLNWFRAHTTMCNLQW